MAEDREIALDIALKSLLATVRGLSLDMDSVCAAAIDAMREGVEYDPEHVELAISEIENAVQALSYPPLFE